MKPKYTFNIQRTLSPQELLNKTGFKQYVDKDIVHTMPQGKGEKVTIEFFTLNECVIDDELEKEYESRGLVPIEPYDLIEFVHQNPELMDTNYIGTHWKDEEKWNFARCRRWDGARHVHVYQSVNDWSAGEWFGGRGKSVLGTSDTSSSLDTESLAARLEKIEDTLSRIAKILVE